MIKRFLFFSTFILLSGCAATDESFPEEDHQGIEENENNTFKSQSVSLSDESEIESVVESEDNQETENIDAVEVEPMRPWEEYEDINEFMEVRNEELLFSIADAPELEDQVELAFRKEITEEPHKVTARWSGFVFTFANQMEEHFSKDYIEKLHELNDSIATDGYEGNIEAVQKLVQEAREIRESD